MVEHEAQGAHCGKNEQHDEVKGDVDFRLSGVVIDTNLFQRLRAFPDVAHREQSYQHIGDDRWVPQELKLNRPCLVTVWTSDCAILRRESDDEEVDVESEDKDTHWVLYQAHLKLLLFDFF